MIIKVCGITNRQDACESVAAGADALGFNFWPKSPRFVAEETARRLAGECPPHVLKVAVFVDETADRIEALMQRIGLDVAQVHGPLDRPLAVRHWLACAAGAPPPDDATAEAFVVDTPSVEQRGGTGRAFDWSLAKGLPGRIVLAGGLAADNVADAIRAARPWGVDACSRLEQAPGRKDPAKVRAFIEAARKEIL